MTTTELQNRQDRINKMNEKGSFVAKGMAGAMQKALDAKLAKTGGVVQRAGVSHGFDASGQANIEVPGGTTPKRHPFSLLFPGSMPEKLEAMMKKAKDQYMQTQGNNSAQNMSTPSSNGTGGGNPTFNSFATNNFGDMSGANNFQNNPLPQDPDAMPGASMNGDDPKYEIVSVTNSPGWDKIAKKRRANEKVMLTKTKKRRKHSSDGLISNKDTKYKEVKRKNISKYTDNKGLRKNWDKPGISNWHPGPMPNPNNKPSTYDNFRDLVKKMENETNK